MTGRLGGLGLGLDIYIKITNFIITNFVMTNFIVTFVNL